jgi:CRP-like cAMP-binding protein
VKRYFIAHEGSLGVQVIYGANDVFPMTVVFEHICGLKIYRGPEVYYYEAMTDITVCSVDADTLRQRVEANPMHYRTLLSNAGVRLSSNIQFLENLRLHGAYNKTAHQLAHLAQQFGIQTAAGIKIQTPLIHQDIADIIGTTRETVTASIIKLRNKNLIQTDSRYIVILDYDQLIREAYV